MTLFNDFVISGNFTCSMVKLSPSYIASKTRKRHAFVVFLTGYSDYVFKDGSVVRGDRDSLVYLSKGSCYEVVTHGDSVCLVLNFDAHNPHPLKPFRTSDSNIPQIKDCVLAAVNAYRRKSVGYIAEILSALYRIVALTEQGLASEYISTAQRARLMPALTHLDAHYLDPELKISTLVSLCGISEKYFTALFSRCFGTTAKQYILDKRLDEAKIMLEATDTSVTDISEYCGFSSVYYFSRLFRQRTGMTPTSYRRTITTEHGV